MKLTILKYESYLKTIKNSVGAKIFRNTYVTDGQKKFDLYDDGRYSCAFFVTTILLMFQLIDAPYARVESAVKNMKKSGWQKRKKKKPRPGDVIIWELAEHDDHDFHEHIGFYIGSNQAISTSRKARTQVRHHCQKDAITGQPRKITAIYYWPRFNNTK
jgi:hypothetical protein